MFIDEDIDFVNSQIDHHRRTIKFLNDRGDDFKARRHVGILKRFEEMLPKIKEAMNLCSTDLNKYLQAARSEKIGSRLGDVSDLPDELRTQLVSVQFDEAESNIVEVMKLDFDGVATIDEILVGLYRRYSDIQQREQLANKIYRMVRKEVIFSVSGKKGVYSIVPTASLEKEHHSEAE